SSRSHRRAGLIDDGYFSFCEIAVEIDRRIVQDQRIAGNHRGQIEDCGRMAVASSDDSRSHSVSCIAGSKVRNGDAISACSQRWRTRWCNRDYFDSGFAVRNVIGLSMKSVDEHSLTVAGIEIDILIAVQIDSQLDGPRWYRD